MAVDNRVRPTTAGRGYGAFHKAARKRLAPFVASGRARCARCGEFIRPGEDWHLGHVDGDRRRYNGAEHALCNVAAAGRAAHSSASDELELEPDGIGADDPCWNVPWLRPLLAVPADAVWPRYMTAPHPSAVGSLGAEFASWAEARARRRLRWWQQLVATRLLEVDADGRLVWETLVLSMARQLGKSWLLRELLFWRVHQGARFGEPQDVLHTGKDLAVCKEVQRPAIAWARGQDGYRIREVNGEQMIELLDDGSRWMLRARGAVYGYSVSNGAVDEAWKVSPKVVDEGIVPTMVERQQPQLLLMSTAHRAATSLMLTRRRTALADLRTAEHSDLLVEWSAPREAELDDADGWRLASPHWTDQRARLVAKQLGAARAGQAEDDPEEPDPLEAFKAQWLNIWPVRQQVPSGNLEDLLPPGLWADLAEANVQTTGPVWLAVEDDFGFGACVAAAARCDDGRLELDGWLCADWDTAMRDVQALARVRQVRHLQVGASLLDRVPAGTAPSPVPAGGAETRVGLALIRDLAAGRMIVHDDATTDLDDAVLNAQVRESANGTLTMGPRGRTHLIRAMVWAASAAHRPTPQPVIR